MIDVDQCPPEVDVDDWFDKEFERQKTRNPLGDRPIPNPCAEVDLPDDRMPVLKDTHEVDEMMDDMLGDLGL